eukprot:350531_1
MTKEQIELKYRTIVTCYLCKHQRTFDLIIFSGVTDIVYFYYNEYSPKYVEFMKIAQAGQLFYKYTGKRRRKPQDRIIKVSFDDDENPKQISWGSGTRNIPFNEIQYIAHGHWTPVFKARKDQLDPKLCFSVVSKDTIVNIAPCTYNPTLVNIWVKGLRMLLNQSDEEADRLSKERSVRLSLMKQIKQRQKKNSDRKDKKRTKSLMLLNTDLFKMTMMTVFQDLETEGWFIDQSVKEQLDVVIVYQEVLRLDIVWRQWNNWFAEKVVTHLKEKAIKYRKYVICYLWKHERALDIIIFDGMTDIVFCYYNDIRQRQNQNDVELSENGNEDCVYC